MTHTIGEFARPNLPLQAAPVTRADAPGTGSIQGGVEADFLGGLLKNVLPGPLGGIAGGLADSLLGGLGI
jgi:hypothetical protein